jgi:hypothetical protein
MDVPRSASESIRIEAVRSGLLHVTKELGPLRSSPAEADEADVFGDNADQETLRNPSCPGESLNSS